MRVPYPGWAPSGAWAWLTGRPEPRGSAVRSPGPTLSCRGHPTGVTAFAHGGHTLHTGALIRPPYVLSTAPARKPFWPEKGASGAALLLEDVLLQGLQLADRLGRLAQSRLYPLETLFHLVPLDGEA